MKRIIYIGLFLMTTMSSAFAQNKADSIGIKKTRGTVFWQNGKNLSPRQLLDI